MPMHRRGRVISKLRCVRHRDQTHMSARIAGDPRIRLRVVGRCDDKQRVFQLLGGVVAFHEGERSVLGRERAHFRGDLSRNHAHVCARVEQSAHFSQGNVSATNHERSHAPPVQYDGKLSHSAHKNFPATLPATRNATYNTSTAAKVTLE